VSRRELDAAGIADPALRASYARCEQLTREHGKTYYLATKLLPASRRPAVYALYGLARYADEIVDDLGDDRPIAEKAAELASFAERFAQDLAAGTSVHPVLQAVVHAVHEWEIDRSLFPPFFASMTMDLSVDRYGTWDDLLGYVDGSAAVIGLQMLPVLGIVGDPVLARSGARDLGIAFQLANFCRDVGEDLDRGRVYLPEADLARFDLTRADLERRVVDDRVRGLLAFEIARVHVLRTSAARGIAVLDPVSRPCIAAALELYCGIADEVAAIDYEVFTHRATVPLRTRLQVANRAWTQRRAAERRASRWNAVAGR
jgi:phytoene synthase